MNRTKIEWVRNPDGSLGYTHNPASGCENHTPEGLCLDGLFPCYAYKLAHTRLKQRYLANHNIPTLEMTDKGYPGNAHLEALRDPFYPRFWEERLGQIPLFGQARGIFVCDMSDLFGIGIPESWTRTILNHIGECQRHRFYLLTKQPANLRRWSPFPDNCYVGVTATGPTYFAEACNYLRDIEAPVKFLSIEPYLNEIIGSRLDAMLMHLADIKWLIIGACTGSWRDMVALTAKYPELAIIKWNKKWVALPRIDWLREIVQAADQAGIKVFLKDNLEPLLRDAREYWELFYAGDYMLQELRQEMPETKGVK